MFNFDEATQKGKEVMDGMLKSYADMSKGFQAIAAEAAEISKKSWMDGVAHAEALSTVKSPEVALEMQAAYLKNAYEGAVAGATRMSEMYVDLARTVYKPFETPVVKKATQKASAAAAAAAAATPAVNAA